MIRTSPVTYCRAAGAVLAAAVLSFATARQAAAQQNIDLFGGTFTGPGMLSLGGTVANTTTTATGTFGPGFTGTVTLGVGSFVTLSETFATLGTSNSFTIAENGLAAVAGSTAATRNYGVSLTPGATYVFTLTRSTAFTLSALDTLSLSLSEGSTQLLSNAGGVGVAGIADVVSLFGTNGTATLQFTVPLAATGTLALNINSTEPVGAIGGSFVFQSATLTQVPEPGTVVASLLGAGALVVLRFRRRLRALNTLTVG